MRLANMMNGLAYPPYDEVCYFQSQHGHHPSMGYFRIDAMPFKAIIHLLQGGEVTIVDATRRNKQLSDAMKFGLPTWCIAFNRALNFSHSGHIEVCPWQTPHIKSVAWSNHHRKTRRTIRKLVKVFGYQRPAIIGENVKIECHQQAIFDDKPKRLKEIIRGHGVNGSMSAFQAEGEGSNPFVRFEPAPSSSQV